MKKLTAPLLSCLASALLCLVAHQVPAQSSPHEGWYEIEVIIFARPLSSDEHWPEDISLDYPHNWEVLKDPEADYQQRLEQAQLQAGTPQPQASDTGGTDSAQALIGAVEPVDLDRSERFRLPEKMCKLNALERRIDAQAGYRVLFHEAWRQYVTGEDQAPWILIEGGESYGEHRELEGSININVARYLHILTDLWFTEFQINTGQSHRQWPSLPESPLKRIERISAQDNTPLAGVEIAPDFTRSNLLNDSPGAVSDGLDTLLSDFLEAPYMPRRIYTLQQRRRMRSAELHYLDHPRLGLLIKILPYEVPEKEAENPAP